jgi:hypothetical protein
MRFRPLKLFRLKNTLFTIAGRKIHIGFLALVIDSGIMSIYATVYKNGNMPTEDKTGARNSSEVEDITNELERHALAHNKLFNESPQADVRTLALNWIIRNDPMKLSSLDSNLHQRYILATRLDSSKYSWLSEENECFWYGVSWSCNDDKVNEKNLSEFLTCAQK